MWVVKECSFPLGQVCSSEGQNSIVLGCFKTSGLVSRAIDGSPMSHSVYYIVVSGQTNNTFLLVVSFYVLKRRAFMKFLRLKSNLLLKKNICALPHGMQLALWKGFSKILFFSFAV